MCTVLVLTLLETVFLTARAVNRFIGSLSRNPVHWNNPQFDLARVG